MEKCQSGLERFTPPIPPHKPGRPRMQPQRPWYSAIIVLTSRVPLRVLFFIFQFSRGDFLMESRHRTALAGTVVASTAGAKRPDGPDGPEFKAKLMVEKVTAKRE